MIPFNDLRPALAEIRLSIDAALWRVMDSGIFLNGPEVEGFENEWAAYCGQRYCVACASGTDALMLAAFATVPGSSLGDIPANTLRFTAEGLSRAPRYSCICDVDERGWPIVYDCTPVLLYGRYPSEKFEGARLIDACQAHGWKPKNPFTKASWSFYPTKNLGSFGDAGAVTTNVMSDEYIMRGRSHTWHSRMSELNAAVLRTKLPHLDRWNAERAAVAEIYYNELPDWCEPACRHGEPTNHHIFAVLAERRDELEAHLLKNGIGVKVHYREPLAELPGARRWCDKTLSLPMWPGLMPKEVQMVCDVIRTSR